jgi:hypothetical protein
MAEILRVARRLEELLIQSCCEEDASPDLLAARRIAADQSMQTGKNYANFMSGRYDHAFGVRVALAAMQYGRRNPCP